MHIPQHPSRPTHRTFHGQPLTDPYPDLRPHNWREALDDPALLPEPITQLLDDEARYAAQFTQLEAEAALVDEFKSRMAPAPIGLETPHDHWHYGWHYQDGADYPCYTRRRDGTDTRETYFDGPAKARGFEFWDLGCVEHAWDHEWIAYSVDTDGNERYQLHVARPGGDAEFSIGDAQAQMVWTHDGDLIYVWLDAESRPREVRRWNFTRDEITLIYAEPDTGWFLSLAETQDGRFGIVSAHQHQVSEVRLLDLAGGELSGPICDRDQGREYEVETHRDRLIIKSNHERADFALYQADAAQPHDWQPLYAPEHGLLDDWAVLDDFLIVLESRDFVPALRWRRHQDRTWQSLSPPEPICDLGLIGALESHQQWQRLGFSSPRHPAETWQLDLDSGAVRTLKTETLPCGHNPDDYRVRREWAVSPDGTRVPLTVLEMANPPSPAPTLLYGYGAYGVSLEPAFSRHRLSLVERGVCHVTAHVRGGMELGYHWYEQGRDAYKTNTFDDFEAALDWVLENRGPRVVIHGGSAGGMLVGCVLNRRAEDLAGVVADVPFVDVLNTMLDPDLPLTPPEWPEWGNPIEDAEAFKRIQSYSPYDNVRPRAYPPLWITAGLTDPRVTFWEPLKWCTRLRAAQTGNAPIVLAMEDAGHGGASGRFGHLADVAQCYRFILDQLTPGWAPPD
ncbi:prolyl oligopeptidase family serine peptidase [Litorivicinus lipolyticus]|uniref:prolyl oligopeptidase family serine peptidase n=1 Tax=Litorivicinus lipolyticus TaxID=418701 RepID=UPI003B59D86A